MDLDARAEGLAALLEARLGIRGPTYEARLARAGRLLPRRVRDEAEYIALARRMQDNPRLAPQIDWTRVEKGHAFVERHLKAIDAWDRHRARALGWLTQNALNLLIVAALVVAALAWRGFL
jgi:hypothetical protein